MASGTKVGAHGRTRRNGLPRISSVEGTTVRMDTRVATMPKAPGTKYAGGFTRPGSRNRKKVGRG
jgi:hypothetical protein